MRKSKTPESRREEILDVAGRLFERKGYASTTINDILSDIGIAKGTFYYYFKSKEEVMDALVLRKIAAQTAEVEQLANDEYLSVNEKMFSILQLLQEDGQSGSRAGLHNNAEMQQKLLAEMVLKLGPVIAAVIKQGKAEGMFATDYPDEVVEQLIVILGTLFDTNMLDWSTSERASRARCFAATMENILGAPRGSFNFVSEMLQGSF